MTDILPKIETHPFAPFVPEGARVLMSGSFPPPEARWCVRWFYPNFQNDMWRIFGVLAADDPDLFVDRSERRFDVPRLEAYCRRIGLALSDTGLRARRLNGDASDKYLEVVEPRPFGELLQRMPLCHTILLTGEKAVETLARTCTLGKIKTGEYADTVLDGREVRVWRMPSSSRAFPRSIAWKADYYRRPFDALGIDMHY